MVTTTYLIVGLIFVVIAAAFVFVIGKPKYPNYYDEILHPWGDDSQDDVNSGHKL